MGNRKHLFRCTSSIAICFILRLKIHQLLDFALLAPDNICVVRQFLLIRNVLFEHRIGQVHYFVCIFDVPVKDLLRHHFQLPALNIG